MGAVFDLLDDELEITEDLTRYEGRWVAIRSGRVVAWNEDPARLVEDPAVEPDDELVPVGAPGAGIYLL